MFGEQIRSLLTTSLESDLDSTISAQMGRSAILPTLAACGLIATSLGKMKFKASRRHNVAFYHLEMNKLPIRMSFSLREAIWDLCHEMITC